MTYTRTISAFNTATASDNKIHDNATASRFGFTGGLVPGVDVFAYMAHAPAKLWGREWLSEGGMRARFVKPVYDGEKADLDVASESEDRLRLLLSARNELCGEGHADRRVKPVKLDIPPAGVQPEPDERPRASMQSMVVGQVFGYRTEAFTKELGKQHLEDTREDAALYDDGAIASPAYMLRRANYILASNVKLGPWIHSESDIRLHGPLRDGDTLDIRARVQDNFERKGHLTVALDFVVLASGKPAMSGRHWAIYEPRQVRG